jgi:thiamine biosynthesis lipoprotein
VTTHVFSTMGTVASLRVDGPAPSAQDLEAVEAVFRRHDQTFSLYDEASPLSRIARGELALSASGAEILDAYALALDWRSRTGGAFTPHRPDGVVDLSGVVKALAMEEAGVLLAREHPDFLLAVGGDILGRGLDEGADWNVGVVDPAHRDRLAALVGLTGSRRAVATSGTAERGQHLWRRGGEQFRQVTVVADDIVTADVLATAIAAGDGSDLDRICGGFDVDVITFDLEGAARATPAARAWVV